MAKILNFYIHYKICVVHSLKDVFHYLGKEIRPCIQLDVFYYFRFWMVQMRPDLNEKMFLTTVQNPAARCCLLRAYVMMMTSCLEISR
jgi:hypothetical protein